MLKFSIDYILNDFVEMPVLEPEEPTGEIVPSENSVEHVKFLNEFIKYNLFRIRLEMENVSHGQGGCQKQGGEELRENQ